MGDIGDCRRGVAGGRRCAGQGDGHHASAAPPRIARQHDHGSGGPHSEGFSFFETPTKWNPGPNTAQVGGYGTPGGVTWSMMGAGFGDASGIDGHHGTEMTTSITSLGVPGFAEADYIAMIDDALNVWASVSGLTNMGIVMDGGVDAGASEASGGHLGDIRIAAWEITSSSTTLARAYQPGTESIFGPGGAIAGDMHIDVNRIWVDDPTDSDADNDYDLFTVILHELGHSLGLGHSTVSGSVMEGVYAGGRRTLHADDIAGIQAIYGPAQSTPEPSSLLLLGTLGLGAMWRRRRQTLDRTPDPLPPEITA